MSGDELVVLLVSAGLALWFWAAWYIRPMLVVYVGRRPPGRVLLQVTPLVVAAVLWVVLETAASHDVRDDPTYLTFYLVLGAAWIGLFVRLLAVAGLSTRDDVLERANGKAAIAVAGAMLAIALCYAGGNIGDGPGWWVVVFCGILSTGTLLLFWSFLDRLTGLADAITIDRDRAAGVRAAGFFLAAGLILGRAAAGDWEGAAPAMLDFVLHGWPVAVLLAAATLLERRLRPSPETLDRPILTHGVLPSLLYLGLGAAAVEMAGSWM